MRKLVTYEDTTIDLLGVIDVLDNRRQQEQEDARYEWLLAQHRRGHYSRPRSAKERAGRNAPVSLACSPA